MGTLNSSSAHLLMETVTLRLGTEIFHRRAPHPTSLLEFRRKSMTLPFSSKNHGPHQITDTMKTPGGENRQKNGKLWECHAQQPQNGRRVGLDRRGVVRVLVYADSLPAYTLSPLHWLLKMPRVQKRRQTTLSDPTLTTRSHSEIPSGTFNTTCETALCITLQIGSAFQFVVVDIGKIFSFWIGS